MIIVPICLQAPWAGILSEVPDGHANDCKERQDGKDDADYGTSREC
jgi:hypothetical protein